jgi:hypothetical protein
MGVGPKGPTCSENLKTEKISKKSVFLIKDLERGYKSQYSPYKVILT